MSGFAVLGLITAICGVTVLCLVGLGGLVVAREERSWEIACVATTYLLIGLINAWLVLNAVLKETQ